MHADQYAGPVPLTKQFDLTSAALIIAAVGLRSLTKIIAMFNCTIRSDYNIVVMLVCYYFWRANAAKTDRISYVVKILILIVQIFDVVWIIVVWSSWTGDNWSSPVWNRLRSWHIIVIVTSIVNWVVKWAAFAFIFMDSNKSPYGGTGYEPLN